MKKKNIIIFALLVLNISFSTNFAYWEGQCKINSTPTEIKDYIKDIRKVITNINKYSIQNKKESSIDSAIWEKNSKNISKTYWSINSLFTWKGYELNYEYSIWENTNEIANQLKRDVKILENERQNLIAYYKKFSLKDLSEVKLKKSEICKGIDNLEEVCGKYLQENTASIDALTILTKWINNLIQQIKNNAVSANYIIPEKIFLLSENDIDMIQDSYSNKNLHFCNLSTDDNWNKWSFEVIVDAFKKLSLTWDKGEESWDEWGEAVELLWWSGDDANYKREEKKLLQNELWNQWIWWDWAKTIMWNLDEYNKNWQIIAWEDWFINSLQSQIDEFEESLKLTENSDNFAEKWISSIDFQKKIWKFKDIERNKIEINSEYNRLKKISFKDDTENDILINRIIEMHLNISAWINTLNKTCEISVKICNQQKKWEWNCWKCD